MKYSTTALITPLHTILLLLSAEESTSFTTSREMFRHRRSFCNRQLHSIAPEQTVDLNKYNLPLSSILTNWTATIQPKNQFIDEGIYLNTINKDTFVDSLTLDIKRSSQSPSLGLLLSELAGGRSDGVGITIVEGIVDGGNADGVGFVEGDSITKLQVTTTTNTGAAAALDVTQDIITIDTECFDYDRTIDAILDLPPPPEEGQRQQIVSVTVKRLRRRPKIRLTLQYPPSMNEPDYTIELYSGENLRRAMLTRGVKLNDALATRFDSGGSGDCGGERTCATCVVAVTKGMELLNPIHIQEKQILEKHPRWRMACRAIVGSGMKEGDMTLRVNPRQWD